MSERQLVVDMAETLHRDIYRAERARAQRLADSLEGAAAKDVHSAVSQLPPSSPDDDENVPLGGYI